MKSSSELFPVALLSAEQKALWSEDTYRLKPNNSADLSAEFVLTRMSLPDTPLPNPILWLPPFLSSRADWRERWEQQVVDLLQQGYEVWLLDWRGHGQSPRAQRWAQTTLADLAQFDLPAAAAFVGEQNAQHLCVVCEETAAEVWLAAHARCIEPSPYLPQLLAASALLLWPLLGRVGLGRYVQAMGWQDRQLDITRRSVQLRNGFDALPRRLFDELLFGRNDRAQQWVGTYNPSAFKAVEVPARERAALQFLSTVPKASGQLILSTRGHLRTGLLRRWLAP